MVSSDRNKQAFDKHFTGNTPFLALPYEEDEVKTDFISYFGITRIPSLIMLGPIMKSGDKVRPIINAKIKGFIEGYKFKEFPFPPAQINDLTLDADEIYDARCLIVFSEGASSILKSNILNTLRKACTVPSNRHIVFYHAFASIGIVPHLRKALDIGRLEDFPVLVLLDIPDDGAYYVQKLSRCFNDQTVLNFLAHPGKRHQLI